MAGKKQAKIVSGIRGLDALMVTDKVTLNNKTWTDISATDARKVVGFEYKGRQAVEFRDAPSDEDEAEDKGAKAETAEQEDKS